MFLKAIWRLFSHLELCNSVIKYIFLQTGLGIRSSVFWAITVFCEKMSEWAIRSKKRAIRSWALIFGERPERFAHGHLFLVSDLSESLMVAHFWWATWVICSRSLICLERPVHFAHSRSFVLSDLSESLTVAHLIWAKWAMSEWANSQPWFDGIFLLLPFSINVFIILILIWAGVCWTKEIVSQFLIFFHIQYITILICLHTWKKNIQ